jgi:hypothetical protein
MLIITSLGDNILPDIFAGHAFVHLMQLVQAS